ncbi:MAG: hypothetical protein CVV27_09330 [Candidatus Melainabacteria bacterium HGW-Melainabacteria-1]|nr:MAG: hypothetical protein CVV27_09330 [Candidatus Melainabacteria bacterium HGW-Melainabacteria-1]
MQKPLLGMRPLMLAAALVLGTAAALPATAGLPATQIQQPAPKAVQNAALDFELVNNTGYDIAHLYISATGENSWNENILSDTLAAGESVSISFDPSESAELWDMRADWDMGDEEAAQEYVYWMKLNLTSITKMTLHYDADKDKTWASLE